MITDRAAYNRWFEDKSGVSADPKKLVANTPPTNANPGANPTTATGGDD